MGTVAPAGGGRRVCHGTPATSAPVDHGFPHRLGADGASTTALRLRGRAGSLGWVEASAVSATGAFPAALTACGYRHGGGTVASGGDGGTPRGSCADEERAARSEARAVLSWVHAGRKVCWWLLLPVSLGTCRGRVTRAGPRSTSRPLGVVDKFGCGGRLPSGRRTGETSCAGPP